jgi:succinyl-CoA synthetase alpha subunit
MAAFGTRIVAGVVPGRAGERVDDVPIYDTVRSAIEATGALTTVAFLPAKAASNGLVEAAEAGIRLGVCVTEGIDPHDLLPALALARVCGMGIVGPNSPGLLVPGGPLLGFLPTQFALPGYCAVLSKSGTLSYEVVWELAQAGFGLSIWIVVGGDRLKGARFSDVIPYLAADGRTRAILLVGEIGGSEEEEAAPILETAGLPAVALIAGRRSPANRTMGHAGALIAGTTGGYQAKAEALTKVGVVVIDRPSDAPKALRQLRVG